MKKLISVLLAALLLLSLAVPALAEDGAGATELQFRADGGFRILNICDIQDIYPMNQTTHAFIEEALALYKPDLVILGGDNCVAPQENKEAAIKEICDLFVNAETDFTLVFGNHDNEQGVDKETLLGYYQQFGGAHCLAYDAEPALFGTGTHSLPIRSSDGSKVAFQLYMFDSNTYVSDADGNHLGYDAVHEDQIAWYKSTAAALAAENGGQVVPAMAFQHIVVQEAYDALF
ncbi:MAG: metallophosphoesterase, partial [Clostridia bacterium]|nr:metallophosphoesterase [Clostridia bacterium]